MNYRYIIAAIVSIGFLAFAIMGMADLMNAFAHIHSSAIKLTVFFSVAIVVAIWMTFGLKPQHSRWVIPCNR